LGHRPEVHLRSILPPGASANDNDFDFDNGESGFLNVHYWGGLYLSSSTHN
jgi:hypothetical protein